MKTKITFLLVCLFCASLIGQDNIELMNPSFEIPYLVPYGNHACCKAPRGWFSCGDPNSNTPDVQPGHFGIDLPPIEGNYYLEMVVRDNDSYEAVSQKLNSALKAGESYIFSIALAHSTELKSQSRMTNLPAKYDKPVVLRIWGGDGYCHTEELLAESDKIDNTEWEQFKFFFKPKKDYAFITFEAFYKTPVPEPYNGNLLLDNCSPIIPLSKHGITNYENADAVLIDSIIGLAKSNSKLTGIMPTKKQPNVSVKTESASLTTYKNKKVPKTKKDSTILQLPIKDRVTFLQTKSAVNNTKYVNWKPSFENISGIEYQLKWDGIIKENLKLYSQQNRLWNGSMNFAISFDVAKHYTLSGKMEESPNAILQFDEFYKTDLTSFSKEASFAQIIELTDLSLPIKGKIKYAVGSEDGKIYTQSLQFIIFPDQNLILFGEAVSDYF